PTVNSYDKRTARRPVCPPRLLFASPPRAYNAAAIRVIHQARRRAGDFAFSPKVQDLQARLTAFMEERVYPNEQTYRDQLNAGPTRWQIPPIMEELKRQAQAAGLWNLFLPESDYGAGLTNF